MRNTSDTHYSPAAGLASAQKKPRTATATRTDASKMNEFLIKAVDEENAVKTDDEAGYDLVLSAPIGDPANRGQHKAAMDNLLTSVDGLSMPKNNGTVPFFNVQSGSSNTPTRFLTLATAPILARLPMLLRGSPHRVASCRVRRSARTSPRRPK